MTESQISYFLAAAGESSITRAAMRLYVSQPAVSKGISSLERELGFPLFMRKEKSIALTPAGSLLYEFFSRTKDEYLRVLKAAGELSAAASFSLRLACPLSWNPMIFYSALKRYIAEHCPSVELSLTGVGFPDMFSMLYSGELDMLLSLGPADSLPPNICASRITNCRCGVIYSSRSYQGVRSLKDLSGVPFLTYENDIQHLFDSVFEKTCWSDFTPVVRDCGKPYNAVFDASRGNGVMLVTDWNSVVNSDLFSFLPLDVHLPVFVFYRKDSPNPYIDTVAEGFIALFSNERRIQ